MKFFEQLGRLENPVWLTVQCLEMPSSNRLELQGLEVQRAQGRRG